MKKFAFALTAASQLCAAAPQSTKEAAQDPPAWTEPTEPFHIVGPIYYVGTRGIGVFLLKSDAGLVLVSGAPSPATAALVASIRKLGFKAEDIKLVLSSHAHFDHAGTLAAFKKLTGAKLVAMDADVELLKSGGALDFLFSNRPHFHFEGVTTDRVIKDKERVTLGNVTLTAHLTPGHTKGCTTWTMQVEDAGTNYNVVFADGTGINPGTRFVRDPSYPGIKSDYERTFKVLEGLRPDIFLAYHAEFFNVEAKRQRIAKEGVKAWIDPKGYAEQVEKRKDSFVKLITDEQRNDAK